MSDVPDAQRPDVLAAGTVLWRPGVEVALVHRPRYDDWSLPKGKLDRGESLADCALRETGEETGVRARLGPRLGDVTYAVQEGRKLVRYWAAEALGGEFSAGDEVDELRWVAPADAAGLLSYAHDVDVLERFAAPRTVLVVVRHAKAGSRTHWTGDDDLRPLSASGRDQAEHLAGFLGRFAPERLHTAPPVRCRDTLAPFAGKAGGTVVDEPLLGENGYWVDEAAGLARFRTLLAEPGVAVLCSQGGVIPEVVGTLLAEADVRVTGLADPEENPVPSRKASTWVLATDAAGTLVSADYYPTPG